MQSLELRRPLAFVDLETTGTSPAADRVVEMPVQRPTSCMFGGPDLSTLFVTSASRGLTPDQLAQQPGAGGLFALATDTRGIPETRFGGRF